MVRVIAGTAGSIKLKTVPEDSTKPTLDRVKEAMFSMINQYMPSKHVLDLFSGNGTLGIEALSRGARFATFNDKSRECVTVIRENLTRTGLGDRAKVTGYDYSEAVSVIKKQIKDGISEKIDLVLLDPPYKKGLIGESLKLISEAGICESGCVAAAEHSAEDTVSEIYGDFHLIKTKKYGTVCVSLFSCE